jgi:REP element-mobilizing transposase RayT
MKMSAANEQNDNPGRDARGRRTSRQRLPWLTPSFPLSSKETRRVVTNVVSPAPHLGWHSRGYLPHWDHPGMIQSLNFRLGDAMPQEVLDRWKNELGLTNPAGSAGVSPAASPTSRRDASAPGEKQRQIELRRRVEEWLDAGHGACWLRQPEVAALVEGALRHFDGERYRLLAWCVMPNHVHALIETCEGFPLADVLHSWKSFTSRKASKLVGRSGEFWQREYLDRYVRNAEHYQAVVAYIEENPVKAGLAKVKTEWPWSSARFRATLGSAGVPPAS